MSIFFEYKEPKDLLAKLVREGRRAYMLSETHQDVCDNFFNYCITAHSLRDWCISKLALSGRDAQCFHDRCNESKYLKYCRDIANTSKHFSLDVDRASTVGNIKKDETEIVMLNLNGEKIENSEHVRNAVNIILSDQEELSMFMLLFSSVQEWCSIFDEYSIERDQNSNSAIIAYNVI